MKYELTIGCLLGPPKPFFRVCSALRYISYIYSGWRVELYRHRRCAFTTLVPSSWPSSQWRQIFSRTLTTCRSQEGISIWITVLSTTPTRGDKRHIMDLSTTPIPEDKRHITHQSMKTITEDKRYIVRLSIEPITVDKRYIMHLSTKPTIVDRRNIMHLSIGPTTQDKRYTMELYMKTITEIKRYIVEKSATTMTEDKRYIADQSLTTIPSLQTLGLFLMAMHHQCLILLIEQLRIQDLTGETANASRCNSPRALTYPACRWPEFWLTNTLQP